ncbi:MAG: UDP-2,3-diacylglucosamine diphosphatase [Gammaproteobacteria bacterium]|nr:UDP-2,3-diacylglucosamine diphosphatase [Gammaproteobacteria bacterium]
MTTLFVSDVHLSASRPAIVSRFIGFLGGEARKSDALYILGDLFDEWLGDDDDRPPHAEIIDALRDFSASGTPLYVMPGNHDFLLGDRFASMSGCRLLGDEAVVDLYGTRVLLMHGDSLCTLDTDYQAFRKLSRDPDVQRQVLELSLKAREARAAEIRGLSRSAMRLKTEEIMDVTPAAVAETMGRHGVTHFIHGHTHRPAVHDMQLRGESGKRIVLGDWYDQDSVLRWSAGGFRLGRLGDPGC